jgi:hypothetical protein
LRYLGYSSARLTVYSLGYTFLGGWAKNPRIGFFGESEQCWASLSQRFPSAQTAGCLQHLMYDTMLA